jgi:hypothetical protein
MANVKFCYPNHTLPTVTVTPTVTGAGWLDLNLLQGEVLSEMARYPGVNPAATKFVIDLGTERDMRILAIPFHNARPGDTARIRVASDAGLTDILLDTGSVEFFQEVYPWGALEWGRVEWSDGRLTPEQAAGRMPPWIYIAPEPIIGRYLEVSFDFSGNPDGYVDVGQIVASPSITPAYNVSYGCTPPFPRDPSTKTRLRGGPQFADKQRKYLYTRMQLDWLSGDELYGQFYELVREYGVTKPIFFIFDSDAPAVTLYKQSFMALIERVGDPALAYHDVNKLEIEISQAF